MGDKTRGLYNKFIIWRTDGEDAPGHKHDGCRYFVLDLTHDPHSWPALKAYAESCRSEYPQLAHDLDELIAAAPGPQPDAGTGKAGGG